MSDQCRKCMMRGDLEICQATECCHHETWYAIEQQARISELEASHAETVKALYMAAEWLEGWASAEPYLSIIKAAIANAEELT